MFKQAYAQYLLVLGLSLAVSIGFQILLPFPFGLIAALAFFLVLPLISKSKLGKGIMAYTEKASVKYRCLVCGLSSKSSPCPRCGSKRSHADFGA